MIGLVIHNEEHRRLLQAMELVGLIAQRHEVALLTVGSYTAGMRFERIIVVDAPEYEARRSSTWMESYSHWLHSLSLGLPPGHEITYLHPAGKPL